MSSTRRSWVLGHDGMTFDVADEFSRIERAMAAWVAASGQPAAVAIDIVAAFEASPVAAAPRLAVLRLGWREGKRTGRFGTDREMIAEYLVTASAAAPATSDAVLARLAGSVAEGLQDIAPVPPSSPLWQSLGLPPRPALTIAASFRLAAAQPTAPGVRSVDARIGLAAPLAGRVMQGEAGVRGARVGIAGDGHWVKTDRDGRFVLGNGSGRTVTVEHRGIRESFTPAPGEPEVVLTLPSEE